MKNLHRPLTVLIINVLLLSLISCSKSEEETVIIRQSDFSKKEAELHDLVQEEKYIALDNTIPLQYVSNVVGIGNRFLITDKDIMYLYSSKGKFIRQIGDKGNGPEEYIRIIDYCADIESGMIFILSPKNKLLIYNLDGSFIKSIIPDKDIAFNKVFFKKDMIYLFDTFAWGTLKYNWIILDSEGNRLAEKHNYIPDYESNMTVGLIPAFENDGKLYYWNNLNDTIFELDGLESRAAYLLADDEARINTDDLKDWQAYSQNEKWQPWSINAISNYLIFTYNVFESPLRLASVLYDISNNLPVSVTVLERSLKNVGISNLLSGKTNFYIRTHITFEGEDYLTGWEDALIFKKKVLDYATENGDTDPDFLQSEQYLTAMKIQENDNPVIILVRLK